MGNIFPKKDLCGTSPNSAFLLVSVIGVLVCTGCAPFTKNLHERIANAGDPRQEIRTDPFSGTCKYDPIAKTYYIRDFLKGSGRLAAVKRLNYNASPKGAGRGQTTILVEEISSLPKVAFRDVPFNILEADLNYPCEPLSRLRKGDGIILVKVPHGRINKTYDALFSWGWLKGEDDCPSFQVYTQGLLPSTIYNVSCLNLKYKERSRLNLYLLRTSYILTSMGDLVITATSPVWGPPYFFCTFELFGDEGWGPRGFL